MKKQLLVAALAAFAMNAALWGASITVTSPGASDEWCTGGFKTYIIRWTKSGAMQATAAIRLRVAGSSEADPAALAIVDGTANDGTFSWTIPASVAPGSYFIRVRTDDSAVIGDSPIFRIKACPGTITVTAPAAGANWQRGSTQTITWTKSGAMQATAAIRLRRAGSPESEAAAVSIVDGTANDGSYSWPIPDTVPEGQYFIRVRTDDSTVIGDSAVFNITKFLVADLVIIPSLTAARDLEMKSVSYTFGHGGQIVARVKNSTTAIDQDVRFSLLFPEAVRDGLQQVTRRLTLAAGAEGNVYLYALPQNNIPLRGMQVQATIDGPMSQITETNEDNNMLETRIAILDLSCSVPQSDRHISKLYLQSKNFRVRFKIKVRHNLAKDIRNIHVLWVLSGPSGQLKEYNHLIDSLAPGEEHVWSVDEKYDKAGTINPEHPVLSEETTYRATASISDPGGEFYDVNPGNNSSSFSFTFPD